MTFLWLFDDFVNGKMSHPKNRDAFALQQKVTIHLV
jgi:hypothetical protein